MQYMVMQCCKTIDAATTKSHLQIDLKKDVNLKKNVLILQQ